MNVNETTLFLMQQDIDNLKLLAEQIDHDFDPIWGAARYHLGEALRYLEVAFDDSLAGFDNPFDCTEEREGDSLEKFTSVLTIQPNSLWEQVPGLPRTGEFFD